MINWINRLLHHKHGGEVEAPAAPIHYRCLVVSRETWTSVNIGDLLEGSKVVEGFHDSTDGNWVLVTRTEG